MVHTSVNNVFLFHSYSRNIMSYSMKFIPEKCLNIKHLHA